MADTSERLFNHYRKDETGHHIIDLSVPSLEKLFSQFDPTPNHHRDIDPQIMKLILDEIVVFPNSAVVELHLHLPKKLKKKVIEFEITQAIRHHFEYEYLDNQLHLERRIQKGLKTLMYACGIFLTLFTSAYFLSQTENVILHLLGEGFWVGSWVSLWHPIEVLLYDWLPLYEEKKKFSRLMETRIQFKYV